MSDSKFYEIPIHLDEIQNLFHQQDIDPLNGRYTSASGLDRLITELKSKSLHQPIRATIFLPPNQISGDLVNDLSGGVRGYCDAQIHQINQDLASTRWQGIKALQTGLLFLAACLLLSAFFSGLAVLPEFLRTFLGEGFLIAGWVSLWHPTELLLYEWWPYWRDKKLYKRIQEMEIIIVPES
jgi:hypothetical protein